MVHRELAGDWRGIAAPRHKSLGYETKRANAKAQGEGNGEQGVEEDEKYSTDEHDGTPCFT